MSLDETGAARCVSIYPIRMCSHSTRWPTHRTRSMRIAGVGTILFNMAVNPLTGLVYVTNSDAHNEVRFAGPGVLAGHSVRGHLHEARITVSTRPPARCSRTI